MNGRTVLFLVIVIILLPFANAVPDSFTMGSYKVSFDIGQRQGIDYTVIPIRVQFNEKLNGDKQAIYSMVIINSTRKDIAGIVVTVTNGPVNQHDWNLMTPLELYSTIPPGWFGSNTADRIIDGNPGVIIEAQNYSTGKKLYMATYQLPTENDTCAGCISYWPWYPDTAKLLDTIRVERVK